MAFEAAFPVNNVPLGDCMLDDTEGCLLSPKGDLDEVNVLDDKDPIDGDDVFIKHLGLNLAVGDSLASKGKGGLASAASIFFEVKTFAAPAETSVLFQFHEKCFENYSQRIFWASLKPKGPRQVNAVARARASILYTNLLDDSQCTKIQNEPSPRVVLPSQNQSFSGGLKIQVVIMLSS